MCIQGFGGETGVKRPLGNSRRKWKGTIKMNLSLCEWGKWGGRGLHFNFWTSWQIFAELGANITPPDVTRMSFISVRFLSVMRVTWQTCKFLRLEWAPHRSFYHQLPHKASFQAATCFSYRCSHHQGATILKRHNQHIACRWMVNIYTLGLRNSQLQ